MKHSDYIEIAKGLGENILQKSIIKGVANAVPFLAAGPFNIILVKFATWLAGKIVNEAEMRIFFAFVDFRTDKQATEFEQAMLYNHHIQLTGTKEQKDEAEKKLSDALTRLVNLRM